MAMLSVWNMLRVGAATRASRRRGVSAESSTPRSVSVFAVVDPALAVGVTARVKLGQEGGVGRCNDAVAKLLLEQRGAWAGKPQKLLD